MAGTDEGNTKKEEAESKQEESKKPAAEETTADEASKAGDKKDATETKAPAKDESTSGEKAEGAPEKTPETEPATPAKTPAKKEGAVPDSVDKRRFFPRVKHLMTREWAYFLSGVLDALEISGASITAAASHKASNPWYKAFDLVYGGIAAECSIPLGKNRYHKFKDKMVELWQAMESQAPDDHPMKQRAVDQLDSYRKACSEQKLQLVQRDDGMPKTPKKGDKVDGTFTAGAGSAVALGKQTYMPLSSATKRSYASMVPNTGIRWKHIDEGEALKKLPEPMQSLLHLRHLGTELKAKSLVEISFQKALDDYLKEDCEKDKQFERALILAALHRHAQSSKESKEILAAYEKAVSQYLSNISTVSV